MTKICSNYQEFLVFSANQLILMACLLIFLPSILPANAESETDLNKSYYNDVIELDLSENSDNLKPADNDEQQNNGESSFEQASGENKALGNLLGLRDTLAKYGLYPTVDYLNNNFQKFGGGKVEGSRFVAQGLLSLAVDAYTKEMHLWDGGHFYVLFNNSVGRSITEDVIGEIESVNDYDTQPITLLTEYWYEHKLFSDHLRIKAGRQDANLSLAVIGSEVEFFNFSFSSPADIPIPTFPDTAVGILGTVRLNSFVKFQAGFFDTIERENVGRIDTFFKNNGHFYIGEIDFSPDFNGYEGNFIAGMWFDTSNFEELSPVNPDNPGIFSSNYGVYTGFEQKIFKENKNTNDDQGLKVLSMLGWAPADRNEAPLTYAGGLSYRGLIPKRDDDVSGIGGGFALVSHRLKSAENRTNEGFFEMFHLFQLKPCLFIQPDFQIIFKPSGIHKNAYVLCLRTVITF